MTSAAKASSVVYARYAKALIELAEDAGSVEKVEEDLACLDRMVADSKDLSSLTSNPLMSRAQQKKAILALADKAKFQDLTKNFLGVLVEKRRLYAARDIANTVRMMLAGRRGEMKATVQTAHALTESQTKALQESISKAVGSDVLLEAQVDPEILGGMVVTVGSQMIDDSVRRKLERLKSAMGKQANENIVQNLEEVG